MVYTFCVLAKLIETAVVRESPAMIGVKKHCPVLGGTVIKYMESILRTRCEVNCSAVIGLFACLTIGVSRYLTKISIVEIINNNDKLEVTKIP